MYVNVIFYPGKLFFESFVAPVNLFFAGSGGRAPVCHPEHPTVTGLAPHTSAPCSRSCRGGGLIAGSGEAVKPLGAPQLRSTCSRHPARGTAGAESIFVPAGRRRREGAPAAGGGTSAGVARSGRCPERAAARLLCLGAVPAWAGQMKKSALTSALCVGARSWGKGGRGARREWTRVSARGG